MSRKFEIDSPPNRRTLCRSMLAGGGLLAMTGGSRASADHENLTAAPSGKVFPVVPSKSLPFTGTVTCPTSLAYKINDTYYWYASYYSDTTNCTLVAGSPPLMTSTQFLNLGCCASGCHCVNSQKTDSTSLRSRFPQTSPTRRHVFGSKDGEIPRLAGLTRLLASGFVLQDQPGFIRVLDQREYQVDELENCVRLFLILCTPPDTDVSPRPPLLAAFGQETNRRKEKTDPRLESEHVPGERYLVVYRPEDNILFHVLTVKKLD